MSQIQEQIEHSYDEIPYISQAFSRCSPLRLEACALLLGLTPPNTKNARILEIGCSFGGNLIPFAVHNPQAKLLGVDLSGEQISAGQKIVEQIGLKNLTLLQKDICEFGDEDAKTISKDGKFDYIIAHGVYSWVPDFVKDAILRLIAERLSPNGVAYLSYNTYPGWKLKDILRDTMLFAAKDKHSMREKIVAAKEVLGIYEQYLRDNLGDSLENSHPARSLIPFIEVLKDNEEHYIVHEYFSPVNDPMYFKDFSNSLEAKGLIYLCESNLSDIFKPKFNIDYIDAYKDEKFKNRIDNEQIMDIFTNRTFRQSLIVRRETYETIAQKQVGPSNVNKIHLVANFTKNKDDEWVNRDNKPMPAEYGWLYEVFSKVYPMSLNLQTLIELLPDKKLEVYVAFLSILTDDCSFILPKPYESIAYQAGVRIKPEILRYLEYFYKQDKYLIGFANEFGLRESAGQTYYLIACEFDGRNSIEYIGEMFANFLVKNKITIKDKNGKPVKGEKNIKKHSLQYVKEIEKLFRDLYLFEWI